MNTRGQKIEVRCQKSDRGQKSELRTPTSDLQPLTSDRFQISDRSSKQGQTLIFMTMVVVMIAFAALFYFDVHKVLHVKAVSRNSGDAAALAGARWQAISLNLTGSLNIAQAQAHIDSLSRGEPDSPEADLIADLRQRIAFSGPMYGYISAQQAAKQNGLFNQQDFADAVYTHANVVRFEYGLLHTTEPFMPSGAYSSAWEEVADMLELAADHGVAVEAAWQYYRTYANMNHLLLNPSFYDAVAGRSWCWFFFNAFDELQNFNHYSYWDDLPPRILTPPHNSEVLSLWVQRLGIRATIPHFPPLPSGSTWANTVSELRTQLENLERDNREAYDAFNANWTFYNSSRWDSWQSRIPENFPWDGEIRPEFDYGGADSAVGVRAQTERHTGFRGADTINWTAGAKPFGSLEGNVTPNRYGLVLPAFSDVRLIPVDTTSGGGAQLRPGWIHFIMNILPDYIAHGPSTLPPGNWYANQLLTWEERTFRESGVDWLLTNSDSCVYPTAGPGGSSGGTSHGH